MSVLLRNLGGAGWPSHPNYHNPLKSVIVSYCPELESYVPLTTAVGKQGRFAEGNLIFGGGISLLIFQFFGVFERGLALRHAASNGMPCRWGQSLVVEWEVGLPTFALLE